MKLYMRVIFVVLSGLLFPLSFAPYGIWPLIIISLFLLLIATTEISLRKAFYLGLLQGMIGYGLSLYWLINLFSTAAIPLYAILALFTAMFCLLINLTLKQVESPILKILAFATLWTAFEFFRCELFFLRFPWITPGTAIGPTWLSPILGVYGTSFLIMCVASAFIYRKTLVTGIILASFVLFLGLFRPGVIEAQEGEGKSLLVAVVQSEECMLDAYTDLTKTIADQSPDLVVWPEYALPFDIRKNSSKFAKLLTFCSEIDAIFVMGTQTLPFEGSDAWYNTALMIDKNGVLGEYYKARPVHMFNDGMAGKNMNSIKTNIGNIATPICFDCDYSTVSRKMTKLGAEFFAVPSFDNAMWSVTQHLQHSMFFRIRAAENSRWLACAASSGVSQIIDPHGNVHQSIPAMEVGAVTGRIERRDNLNFYVRFGWLFPWITIGCSLIFLLKTFYLNLKKTEL